MSYTSAKQRYVEKKEISQEQEANHNCFANGCPMAGGISTGGNWVCAYHHQATSDMWPRVTQALRDCETIRVIAFLRQLHDSFSLASDPSGLKRKS
jgi:hypothetical protein